MILHVAFLSILLCLGLTQQSFAHSNAASTSEVHLSTKLTVEQRNKINYARRKNELDNLLKAPTKFPVVYEIRQVEGEQNIVLIMLKADYKRYWNIIDKREKDLSGQLLRRQWEISPRVPN